VTRAQPAEASEGLLARLIDRLAREAGLPAAGGASSSIRGLTMRVRERGAVSAVIDIECPRDQA
jgi:hypothetical protein